MNAYILVIINDVFIWSLVVLTIETDVSSQLCFWHLHEDAALYCDMNDYVVYWTFVWGRDVLLYPCILEVFMKLSIYYINIKWWLSIVIVWSLASSRVTVAYHVNETVIRKLYLNHDLILWHSTRSSGK